MKKKKVSRQRTIFNLREIARRTGLKDHKRFALGDLFSGKTVNNDLSNRELMKVNKLLVEETKYFIGILEAELERVLKKGSENSIWEPEELEKIIALFKSQLAAFKDKVRK